MALSAVVAAVVHRDNWFSVFVLALVCAPFFAVPGLSDVQYMPFDRNSPIVGGSLAFLVGLFLIYYGRESWQIVIAALFGVFMVWSGFRSLGGVSESVHALGLEVIFYTMMAISITSRLEPIRRRFPDLIELRDSIAWLRIG